MSKGKKVLVYVFFDWLCALITWISFYIFRKLVTDPKALGSDLELSFDDNFYLGIFLIPIFWVMLFLLFGAYRKDTIYHKSRFKEITDTFNQSILGSLVLFFFLILDDLNFGQSSFVYSFLFLVAVQFALTGLVRVSITHYTKLGIYRGNIQFNTLLVGSSDAIRQTEQELNDVSKLVGYKIVGYLNNDTAHTSTHYAYLGSIKNILPVLKQYDIEELIIAFDPKDHEQIYHVLNEVEDHKVSINIIPDMYSILMGSVKMNYLFGVPLIRIEQNIMPYWQEVSKRVVDVFISLFALIVLFPLYVCIALAVRFSSKGPVFYFQERIGWHASPFNIIKFRTMRVDAETDGPQLSSEKDPRITVVGKFLRKTRLDELPQFVNVLIGQMSIVGPRPERKYFIDLITQKAPHYKHLHKVRPGITSWGQVKYGYAENVDQMIERLKFDIIYVENMSIYLDIKILLYTVYIMFRGRGK